MGHMGDELTLKATMSDTTSVIAHSAPKPVDAVTSATNKPIAERNTPIIAIIIIMI